MKKRNKSMVFCSIVLLFASIFTVLYPVFRTVEIRVEEQTDIRDFQTYVEEPPDAAPETDVDIPFADLYAACVAYNANLVRGEQSLLSAAAVKEPPLRLEDYGYEEDVFGYLSIPAAGIESPIRLGASSANLDAGCALLGQTSMPIGGTSTHSVIAGHRTWSGGIVFKGLEKLEPGDSVQITNPWETLTYTVVSTQIIRPNETEKVKIQNGKDLLSVFTCTYPNTRRVLVTCERMNE